MPPPWLLHPELSSSEIPAISIPSFAPHDSWAVLFFSIFCMVFITGRVLMDSSFIKKSSLTFVHQKNVLCILLKHESIHFLARRLMRLHWQGKDMSRRILGRIKEHESQYWSASLTLPLPVCMTLTLPNPRFPK